MEQTFFVSPVKTEVVVVESAAETPSSASSILVSPMNVFQSSVMLTYRFTERDRIRTTMLSLGPLCTSSNQHLSNLEKSATSSSRCFAIVEFAAILEGNGGMYKAQ